MGVKAQGKNPLLNRINQKLGSSPLVVSAGMQRSGSTLLFNILREVLVSKWGEGLSSGWEGDMLSIKDGDIYLIKTHNIVPFYRKRAAWIFYTFRDVRVAAVSQLRKFGQEITMDSIRAKIKQYVIAKQVCRACFKYEEFVYDPLPVVSRCCDILGVDTDPEKIVEKVRVINPPETLTGYSRKTLLHKGHFTNTKVDDWRSVIPEKLRKQICREFSWWFTECGYKDC